MKKDILNKKATKELVGEIKRYNRAHNRLINKLMESSREPMFVLSTLHSVHAISMKYEQEAVSTFICTQKETKTGMQSRTTRSRK